MDPPEIYKLPMGSIHQIEVYQLPNKNANTDSNKNTNISVLGLRLVEETQRRIREEIGNTPLHSVSKIYNDIYTSINDRLNGTNIEEYIKLCSNIWSIDKSLYMKVQVY